MILFRTLMGDEGKHVQKYQSKFSPEESSRERERERKRGGWGLTFWNTLSQHKLKTFTALLSEKEKKIITEFSLKNVIQAYP